jgi:hypothetical protein
MQNYTPSPSPQNLPEEEKFRLELIDRITNKFSELDSSSNIFYDEISNFLKNYLPKSKIDIKTLTKLSQNIDLQNFAISGANIKNFQEIFLYSNFSDDFKFSAILEICSKFPNLKLFSLNTANLNQFYDNIGLGSSSQENEEIKSFISNQQYSSITQHNGYGPNRFFLTIDNGRILTFPKKEFREFYPIIVKEIFEKTEILDSTELQSYSPIFEDQNHAEKFLILLYKLARANDLLDLTENQKRQITSLFSNIKNLTPQDDSLLNEIISQEDISLNQLEQFYKEELSLGVSIEDQINRYLINQSSLHDPNPSIENTQSAILSIINRSNDEKYKVFFQRHLNDLLGTNYDFSNANITKENSQSFLQLTLLYSKSEITENQQFKNNLTKLLEIIATKTNIIGVRNDQTTDSQKALDAINNFAAIHSLKLQETSKPKFQIFISSLANSANLFSANFSQNHSQNQIQIGAGVFAMRGEENQGLNNAPQLPTNFNQSPNYANQLFLAEVLGDDFYSENFANQAGQNLDQFIQHLFFNTNSEELRGLLGETRFNELQEKLSNSSLDCLPAGDPNAPAYFVTPNTLGNPGENKVGALIYDNALNMGIFNGVKLKLGLRINEDGSKEQGLFDDQQNLLIDSASVIEMYKKSGMNSDSLVSAITKFGSLNNSGNGQSSYIESESTFSLRCLNGKWYLGIFQNKQDEQGNNQLEFRGAIKINDINTIIKIPESTTQSNLDQKIEKERNEQGIKNLGEVNPTEWITFRSDSGIENNPALTRVSSNISQVRGDSLSRISLDGIQSNNSSIQDERQRLLSTGDEEDPPKAHCCCNLFSRVSKGLIRMQKQASPIIKAIKSTNLSSLIKTFSQYR